MLQESKLQESQDRRLNVTAWETNLVRPERFELPTYCSGGNRSIHLSYGRALIGSVYTGGIKGINVCRLKGAIEDMHSNADAQLHLKFSMAIARVRRIGAF